MDLVIYYTRTNNTRKVSEIIAEEKDAKLLEIVDKKNRSGPIQYMIGAFDALRGKDTDIHYEKVNLNEFDTVYIGTPVWASKAAPAITKFIDENDFSNVNVVTFATMGSNGGDSTVDMMNKKIKAKGGVIKRSFALAMKNNDIKSLVIDALNDE